MVIEVKSKFSSTNPNFRPKIQIFDQKSKFSTENPNIRQKIWTLLKNRNFPQKSKFWSNNPNFRPQSKIWSNNPNFRPKIQIQKCFAYYLISLYTKFGYGHKTWVILKFLNVSLGPVEIHFFLPKLSIQPNERWFMFSIRKALMAHWGKMPNLCEIQVSKKHFFAAHIFWSNAVILIDSEHLITINYNFFNSL